MFGRVRQYEDALFDRFGWRKPQGRVERGTFRLLALTAVFFLLSFLPGGFAVFSGLVAALAAAALLVLLIVLVYRWTFSHLLWTVRNRLILTCVLMGLAPVVLFAILAGIAAYVFSGQFATTAASGAIDDGLAHLRSLGSVTNASIEQEVELNPSAPHYELPTIGSGGVNGASNERAGISAWRDGKPLSLQSAVPYRSPTHTLMTSQVEAASFPAGPLPAWLTSGFTGIVARGGKLYLCAASMTGPDQGASHPLMVVATVPLDDTKLTHLARGLGSISILPIQEDAQGRSSVHFSASGKGSSAGDPDPDLDPAHHLAFSPVQGGILPPPAHFFDNRVLFYVPEHITAWSTGAELTSVIGVTSRPTLLYNRLFATSVRIGAFVRNALILIAILFSMLELVAFLMAVRLSRTITHSIADLYGATTEIDRGNLAHRIPVERADQLGALATSFNTMAGSLAALLEEQREKERMQGELAIAQEVQKNLFPRTPTHLPAFELYGVCKPARTVSGDYYDFIHAGGHEIYLALGDISGKGISAALLMASLHSAVRAYHSGAGVAEASAPPSPAHLLGQLNRHLLSSTQPEKYATLFLASYDSVSCRLTYANGGHLTPFILCNNGSVKRLDCGGSVVGLLGGMRYVEDTIQLDPGDLLLAYSDGLTEPENDFGEFGEDRLLDLVHQNRDQPLASIASHALRALGNWIGDAEQPDDMTLVLARQL